MTRQQMQTPDYMPTSADVARHVPTSLIMKHAPTFSPFGIRPMALNIIFLQTFFGFSWLESEIVVNLPYLSHLLGRIVPAILLKSLLFNHNKLS